MGKFISFLQVAAAKIARARKAVTAASVNAAALVAVIAGFDPKLAAAIAAVLTALGVYRVPNAA